MSIRERLIRVWYESKNAEFERGVLADFMEEAGNEEIAGLLRRVAIIVESNYPLGETPGLRVRDVGTSGRILVTGRSSDCVPVLEAKQLATFPNGEPFVRLDQFNQQLNVPVALFTNKSQWYIASDLYLRSVAYSSIFSYARIIGEADVKGEL